MKKSVPAIHVLVAPDTPNLQPVPSAPPTAAHAALLTAPLAQADTAVVTSQSEHYFGC